MSQISSQEILRRLPGVDRLPPDGRRQGALGRHPRRLVLESVRQVLESRRREILADPSGAWGVNLEVSHLVELVMEQIEVLDATPFVPLSMPRESSSTPIWAGPSSPRRPSSAWRRSAAATTTWNTIWKEGNEAPVCPCGSHPLRADGIRGRSCG